MSFDMAVKYVLIKSLRPSQVRYSSKNVERIIERAKRNASIGPNGKQTVLKFDTGKSIFSLEEALPVIETSFGYVAIDGHHNILTSLALQASTIPIKVQEQRLAAKDNETFWKWAEENNYAYLRRINETKSMPVKDFNNLEDDPVRYFVGNAAREFRKGLRLEQSTGAEYPLWVKIYNDIPFIEFKIADILYVNGFQYFYEDDLRLEGKIEEAREILKEHPMLGLRLLPKKEHFKESNMIKEWLRDFDKTSL